MKLLFPINRIRISPSSCLKSKLGSTTTSEWVKWRHLWSFKGTTHIGLDNASSCPCCCLCCCCCCCQFSWIKQWRALEMFVYQLLLPLICSSVRPPWAQCLVHTHTLFNYAKPTMNSIMVGDIRSSGDRRPANQSIHPSIYTFIGTRSDRPPTAHPRLLLRPIVCPFPLQSPPFCLLYHLCVYKVTSAAIVCCQLVCIARVSIALAIDQHWQEQHSSKHGK